MRNAIDEPEGSRYFNGEFRRAIKVSIPKTHISAKPRRERKRDGEETAQLTTKSGHPLKFTSSWRARILLSNGTPHSSLLRVNLRVEIRSIDRSESRTRVFPDLRIQPAARVPRRGIRGEVDSRMDQSGDRVEKRTPPPFKRRWTTMIARILSLLSCSYFLGVTCSGCSRSPIRLPCEERESDSFSPLSKTGNVLPISRVHHNDAQIREISFARALSCRSRKVRLLR